MFQTPHTNDLELEMIILRDKITRADDPMPRQTIIRAAAEKELLARQERAAKQDFFIRKQGWKVRPFEAVMKAKFGKEIAQFQQDSHKSKRLERLRKSCKTERAFECARILFNI